MARTTLDIDPPILGELKQLAALTGESLGRVASQLLADGLARRSASQEAGPPFAWRSRDLQAHGLAPDQDAVQAGRAAGEPQEGAAPAAPSAGRSRAAPRRWRS